MNGINSEKFETAGKILSRKRSSPGIYSFSPSVALAKLGFKKTSNDAKGRDCVNTSKIPRPPMTTSYSFNETLKSNQSNGKTKKAPSMIPRSKSRKRNENAKIRIDIPSKAESPKKYFNKSSNSNSKELNEMTYDYEYELGMPSGKPRKLSLSTEHENMYSKQEVEISSLNLKSYQNRNLFKDKDGDPDRCYSATQEDVLLSSQMSRKEGENKGPSEEKVRMNYDTLGDGREAKNIKHLYEAIKVMVGPFLKNFTWSNADKSKSKESEVSCCDSTATEIADESEAVSESSSIQEHYDFTLKEISNIWKSTISLLASVKNHAVKFVEENNKLIDKEQLSLEAEMLQAALDFAVCYSKLKSDFLVTAVKERLNPRASTMNKLENLMDSKVLATLYNVEDLALVAQNVHDLSRSLIKGEDVGLD